MQRPSSPATPRRTRPWTSRASTPPTSWPSWRAWPSAPGSSAQHPAYGHRGGRRGRHPLCEGTGLQHQAASRGGTGARRVGIARFAHLVRRGAPLAECAGPIMPCEWSATPWDGCYSTAWRRADAHRLGGGCRPDRHGCRPKGDHLPPLEPLVERRRSRRAGLAIRPRMPGRFYLRLNVDDRLGVMSEITDSAGRTWAFPSPSVIRHETEEVAANVVPLVIMTHNSTEGDVAKAMTVIGQLSLCPSGQRENEGEGLGMRDQGSGVRDQGSGIRGQGSGVRRSRQWMARISLCWDHSCTAISKLRRRLPEPTSYFTLLPPSSLTPDP